MLLLFTEHEDVMTTVQEPQPGTSASLKATTDERTQGMSSNTSLNRKKTTEIEDVMMTRYVCLVAHP